MLAIEAATIDATANAVLIMFSLSLCDSSCGLNSRGRWNGPPSSANATERDPTDPASAREVAAGIDFENYERTAACE
jgi:hypothetical protein